MRRYSMRDGLKDVARPVAVAVSAAAAVGLLGACKSEVRQVPASDLLDNPCSALPNDITTELGLVATDDRHRESKESTWSFCLMSGQIEGQPVTLSVTLTSRGFTSSEADDGQGAARQKAAEDLARSQCSELRGATTQFGEENGGCHGTAAPGDSGSATHVDVLDPSLGGIVEVVIAYEGKQWNLIADSAAKYASDVAGHFAMASASELAGD